MPLAELRHPLDQRLLAHFPHMLIFAQRESHEPRMALHSPLVALLNGKSQRVVTRRTSLLSCEHIGKRLDGRAVCHIPTQAGLEENRIEVCLLQLVQHLAQRLLLQFPGSVIRCSPARPIQSIYRRQPHSTYFCLQGLDSSWIQHKQTEK